MDNKAWEVPSGSGITLAAALKCWLTTDAIAAPAGCATIHVDAVAWPGNEGCEALGVADVQNLA